MLHLIVKQLELSETLDKITGDIKRLEDEIGKVLMGRPPPPVMHNKADLEKDIDGLKVSLVYLGPVIYNKTYFIVIILWYKKYYCLLY